MAKNKEIRFDKFLIVKCKPLDDQWECDADRTPICIVDQYEMYGYKKFGFEIYGILPNGNLKLLQEYDKY